MCLSEITVRFPEDYREAVDGAVVAYLQDCVEIDHQTWAVLSGADPVPPRELSLPVGTPSRPGDFGGPQLQSISVKTTLLAYRQEILGLAPGCPLTLMVSNEDFPVAWWPQPAEVFP
jgi:hypothetical protein